MAMVQVRPSCSQCGTEMTHDAEHCWFKCPDCGGVFTDLEWYALDRRHSTSIRDGLVAMGIPAKEE